MNQASQPARRYSDPLIMIVALLLVFILAARTPLDSDLWWHLAAGQYTWQSGVPLVRDVFSFTRFGQPWVNHSWLSQVLLFGLYQTGGWLALSAWTAALAAASMGFVFAQMRGPAIFRAFLVIFASTVAAVVWSPRPQLVSLLFFSILGWILVRYKWSGEKRLWLLPLLFWLWSNFHGGWALGFMLIGLFLAGEGLNHLLRNDSAEVLTWRAMGRLAAWTAASIPALAIQPNGLRILTIPFQTVEVQVLQQFIQEWASPDFHQLYQQPYLWLLLVVWACFGLSGRKVDGSDLLVTLGFGALGLVARRNFAPFALAATPVLSRYLWVMIRSWHGDSVQPSGSWGPGEGETLVARRRPRWQRRINLALVGLLAMVALLKVWAVTYPPFVESSAATTFPTGAMSALQKIQAKGNLFNEYNWGGYILWSDPDLKVFVDGRTDLYGDPILGEWMQILQAQGDWAQDLADRHVDWVLIEKGRPLAAALAMAEWRLVYQDDLAVVYQSVR